MLRVKPADAGRRSLLFHPSPAVALEFFLARLTREANREIVGVRLVSTVVLAVGVCSTGCMRSTLPMVPGVPITVERGYCFVSTQFTQRGKQLNRGNTLDTLETYPQSEPYVSAGNSYDVASFVTGFAGAGLVTAGALGASDTVQMTRGTSTALIATGAAMTVFSLVFCGVAEGKYASAVDVYNAQVATPEPNREPVEDDSKPHAVSAPEGTLQGSAHDDDPP